MILKKHIQKQLLEDNDFFYHFCKTFEMKPPNGVAVLRSNTGIILKTIVFEELVKTHLNIERSEIYNQ